MVLSSSRAIQIIGISTLLVVVVFALHFYTNSSFREGIYHTLATQKVRICVVLRGQTALLLYLEAGASEEKAVGLATRD